MVETEKLTLQNDSYIAYRQVDYGHEVSVVFLGGFASNMNGTKASALLEYCTSNRINCTVFDYLGHGSSSGEFEKCTLSTWYGCCIQVIESIAKGKLVLVGSSMGGWLMLLAAMSHASRICGLIGLAPAPDFTETLGLTGEENGILQATGKVHIHRGECSYTITEDLITDGKRHLLLDKQEIAVTCPITLIHGMQDNVVSYNTSLSIAERVASTEVNVHLIKSANHYLNDTQSLSTMFRCVQDFIQRQC